MNELLERIASGNAVLFVGAGFSIGADNLLGDVGIPLASDLAHHIGQLGEFDDEKDLKFAADYFLSNLCFYKPQLKQELIDLLQSVFTVSVVKEEHKNILKVPWKRIYTTNYDDLIEMSARAIKKKVLSVTVDDLPKDTYPNKLLCIHLNGSISRLDEDSLNNSFKLSQSSYLSSDSFVNSSWNYMFKQDLELSSAIVFLGYSLYDLDVEKILYENPSFKEKTYFIQRSESEKQSNVREDYIFRKYGKLERIGVKGFANLLRENMSKMVRVYDEDNLSSFTEFSIIETNKSVDISDSKIESFLRHGEIQNELIQEGMTSDNVPPFLIRRAKIDEAKNQIKKNQIICINSELGNGKSIFLKEFALNLVIDGYKVLYLSDETGNYIRDLDILIGKDEESILFIDSYSNYKSFVDFLSNRHLGKVKIVLSERTSIHHSFYQENEAFSRLKIFNINIDVLNEEEINFLVSILNHTSLWGESVSKHNFNEKGKKDYLKNRCRGQLANALIDTLNSPNIERKINDLTQPLFQDEKKKKIVFIVCLLDFLDVKPITLALISKLGQDDVSLVEFASSNDIRQLFTVDLHNSSILTKSSIYSLHLLNSHFSNKYVVDSCLDILVLLEKDFSENRNSLNYHLQKVRTELFRFNVIEKILSNQSKIPMLERYYKQIKSRLRYHETNPQYWLQYGMVHIAIGKYELAKRYLDNALKLAPPSYRIHKILNQKARLNLNIASQPSTDKNMAINLFKEADKWLAQDNSPVYKYKIVVGYLDFYEARAKNFDRETKKMIIKACEVKLAELRDVEINGIFEIKDDIVFRKARKNLEKIIDCSC